MLKNRRTLSLDFCIQKTSKHSLIFSILIMLRPLSVYLLCKGKGKISLQFLVFKVVLFFVLQAQIPREEMYLLSAEKFERACAYISACEDGLVGQAVVARNDGDGMFYLGKTY